MKRFLKVSAFLAGGIFTLLLIAIVGLYVFGSRRLNQVPEIPLSQLPLPDDGAALAHGQHLVDTISSCRLCHGLDLEGDVLIDGEMGMYVVAPNLTTGTGGVGSFYQPEDWERALRHGIGHDGRVLVIMPAEFYQYLGDDDLVAMIAFLETVPPMDNDLGERRLGLAGTILGGTVGYSDFTGFGNIDHLRDGTNAPAAAVSAEYGEYLSQIGMCRECHGPDLAGIVLAEGEDGPPEGPNLTPGGELRGWAEADFIQALREGETPSGRTLDPEQMPWETLGQMSEPELQALWLYLSQLPPLPTNGE